MDEYFRYLLCSLNFRLAEVDEFVKQLWGLLKEISVEGIPVLPNQVPLSDLQEVSPELFRSDYMIHDDASGRHQIKQVEMNTIAAGGAGLGSANTKLHRCFSTLH